MRNKRIYSTDGENNLKETLSFPGENRIHAEVRVRVRFRVRARSDQRDNPSVGGEGGRVRYISYCTPEAKAAPEGNRMQVHAEDKDLGLG